MAIKAKTKGLFSYRLREEKQAGSSRFEHYHDGYELTYFSKGNVTLFVKDGAIDARSGDLLLIRPREVHHLKYNESGYSRYILYFQPSFVDGLLHSLGHGRLLEQLAAGAACKAGTDLRTRRELNRLLQSAHTLASENGSEADGSELRLSRLKLNLVSLLIVFSGLLAEEDGGKPVVTAKEAQARSIAAFIDEHFREPVTLQALADRFHLNRCYISHMFKEVTGFTIGEYAAGRKIAEAQSMIRDSGLPVAEIGYACGFRSTQHFYGTFRKVTGTTPAAYKKMFGTDVRASILQ